jgi:hypothetical protein
MLMAARTQHGSTGASAGCPLADGCRGGSILPCGRFRPFNLFGRYASDRNSALSTLKCVRLPNTRSTLYAVLQAFCAEIGSVSPWIRYLLGQTHRFASTIHSM